MYFWVHLWCLIVCRHHLVARAESFIGDFRAALQHEKAAHTIYSSKVSGERARVCCGVCV